MSKKYLKISTAVKFNAKYLRKDLLKSDNIDLQDALFY